ncbi:hypothetical protein H4Q26_008802 [Puccinia striiformis f. sp. tritici PST-130]|nr:hypothetical protein H4Q26_008802 [Puccinia striiformis f. sp. tritici PST-130]
MIEKQTREPFAIPAAEGGGWMDTYEALRKIASDRGLRLGQSQQVARNDAPTAVQTKETYEEIRQRNIAANRSLLLSLQLSGPGHGTNLIPKTALKSVSVGGIGEADKESKSATTTKKKTRKSARRDSTGVDEVQEENPETTGRRRSGRISQLKQQTVTKRARENDESESESGDEYKGRDDEGSDEEIAVPGQGRKRKSNWRPPTNLNVLEARFLLSARLKA